MATVIDTPTVAPVAPTITPSVTPNHSSGDSDYDSAWKVIVMDDTFNTFESVAGAISKVIPGVSYEKGLKHANEVHTKGQAMVWSGHRELAEHYHNQLTSFGLTMAPLEK